MGVGGFERKSEQKKGCSDKQLDNSSVAFVVAGVTKSAEVVGGTRLPGAFQAFAMTAENSLMDQASPEMRETERKVDLNSLSF